ncbi:MAG: hypothetical protein EA382_02680 [Spirochaetaceae bacterium]|nr:MAG: hypothetical protein EA382_02680 [Spirochaetaceae bacterium]
MRKRTVLALLTLLTAATLHAREHTIVLGTDDAWNRLASVDRIVSVPGRQGFTDLRLEAFRHEPGPDTELLIQFDELPLRDSTGRYAVRSADPELAPTIARTGRAALLVDSPDDVITVEPLAPGLFAPGMQWGSFTVDFWLYPVQLADGDTYLSWSAREGAASDFRDQRFAVQVDQGAIAVVFRNFFVRPDGTDVPVRLVSNARLIPRTWAHHAIRFSGETGLLEYLIDGRTVALTHVSETGRQDGSVFYPRIAAVRTDGLRIAERMRGAIDEVRIERRFIDDLRVPEFSPAGGRVVSEPIDLGSTGARVLAIDASIGTPGLSDVFLYYRVSNVFGADGEWNPVRPGTRLDAVGRYVQVRADLFPDTRDHLSPMLSDLTIAFEPSPPPRPPAGVRAIPMDGAVRIEWTPVRSANIVGYRVYYGTDSGRYFGDDAAGASPIDAGNVTSFIVDGLANGTLYFFAVGAYDEHGRMHEYQLSAEAAARPGRVHR